jgi:hypothetical protein
MTVSILQRCGLNILVFAPLWQNILLSLLLLFLLKLALGTRHQEYFFFLDFRLKSLLNSVQMCFAAPDVGLESTFPLNFLRLNLLAHEGHL